MKKALFLIIAIVACCFLLGNANTISDIYDATQAGATIPLVLACIAMVARHLTEAVSYKASFEAVGFKGPRLWDYIVLIFSLVFINTFCLFSGATGVAFIVDHAHRKGADLGRATSGAILSQIGYFAAVLVISIIGFVTMILSGAINTVFVVGALVLALTLVILSSLFVIGYFKANWLYRLFGMLQKPVRAVAHLFKKDVSSQWGRETADSFVKSARIMARNPSGTAISVAWASFSAILNLICLVFIGYAFGFENVAALIAAFALAAISVILSPTPQGIGVVEAAVAAVLTAHGCSLATATAIALVYRGVMFWIPFCIGAVMLSQSGFFQSKKNPTQEQHDKDIGWIAGTLVGLMGLVNVGIAIIPSFFAPYGALVAWVSFGDFFAGPALIFFGLLLVLMAVGLIKRYRTCFALTTTLLVLMAGVEFLFYATITVAIASVALGAWMFWKRAAFDRPIPWLPQWGAGRSDDPRMKTPRERAEDMGPREAARGKRETMQKMREGDTSDPRVRLAARMDKDGAAVEVDDDGKE
jgi:phosphatidylglycerol lysyltransferase